MFNQLLSVIILSFSFPMLLQFSFLLFFIQPIHFAQSDLISHLCLIYYSKSFTKSSDTDTQTIDVYAVIYSFILKVFFRFFFFILLFYFYYYYFHYCLVSIHTIHNKLFWGNLCAILLFKTLNFFRMYFILSLCYHYFLWYGNKVLLNNEEKVFF
jgi:hypothetical protein